MTDVTAPLSRPVRRKRSRVGVVLVALSLLLALAGSLLFAR
jgi:hypothetical protein